jgi:small subunit ribosomal protein S17
MAKKTFIGKIVSAKTPKTVVIEVQRMVAHPVYKKVVKRSNRIKADIGNIEAGLGKFVKIEQTSPISRDKHFKVIEVLKEVK